MLDLLMRLMVGAITIAVSMLVTAFALAFVWAVWFAIFPPRKAT